MIENVTIIHQKPNDVAITGLYVSQQWAKLIKHDFHGIKHNGVQFENKVIEEASSQVTKKTF